MPLPPMRKPKGKLVALLAGAVVVALLAVVAMFWKDVYCHLYLDPRLVGRWRRDSKPMVLQFDRIGNVRLVEGELHTATYRIDGTTLIFVWPEEEDPDEKKTTYEVGDTLSIEIGEVGDVDHARNTFHRVPDDSSGDGASIPRGLKCHLSPRPLKVSAALVSPRETQD